MKKLKLNLQNIEGAELLTREQLKTVTGGSWGGLGGDCIVNSDCGSYDSNGWHQGYCRYGSCVISCGPPNCG